MRLCWIIMYKSHYSGWSSYELYIYKKRRNIWCGFESLLIGSASSGNTVAADSSFQTFHSLRLHLLIIILKNNTGNIKCTANASYTCTQIDIHVPVNIHVSLWYYWIMLHRWNMLYKCGSCLRWNLEDNFICRFSLWSVFTIMRYIR